jgi:hypothetical protein
MAAKKQEITKLEKMIKHNNTNLETALSYETTIVRVLNKKGREVRVLWPDADMTSRAGLMLDTSCQPLLNFYRPRGCYWTKRLHPNRTLDARLRYLRYHASDDAPIVYR